MSPAVTIRRSHIAAVVVLLVLALLAGGRTATAQMPDMAQMSGIPRPVDDLPVGSVSVRVIRGDLSNPIVGNPVEMRIGDKVTSVNTDDQGRAQFDNIVPGSPVTFSTVVDGKRLDSQPFNVQPQGGVRMLLVATDPGAAKAPAAPAAPAVTGAVTIAGESRIVIEPADGTLSVYYILHIVNGSTSPVNPEKPFVFSMPADATNTTVIQGSSPLASNSGRDVTVAGPFPPGTTAIQVAAEFPVTSGAVSFSQVFPANMPEPIVLAKKEGAMSLSSPQLDRVQDTVTEGTAVLIGAGAALNAGSPLTITLSGLPHHSAAPRNIALILAGVIVVIGFWAATRTDGGADRASERKRLISRREKMLQDLVRLEQDHRRGKIDGPRYSARREELLQALEHVYGALEEDGAAPEPAGTTGAAAARVS